MKKLLLATIALGGAMTCLAQTDTTIKGNEKSDTIRIGGMVIIKNRGEGGRSASDVIMANRRKKKQSNLTTNWWIPDIGFANLNDKTDYTSAGAQAFAPGANEDKLELRTGKSVNVNIWFFMQRLNMVKHVVNLKYGLGLELNNYHFDDESVRFSKNPTLIAFNGADVKKNKLAADYVTVPMMLNLNFTPKRKNGFGLSGGVSAGYLYSSRQKLKDNDDKRKVRDDFDLRKWKLSYVGELNLGPVKLYGSYAFKSMWKKGLDQTPYNVGIRIANW